jgi:uncharacterized protein YciI
MFIIFLRFSDNKAMATEFMAAHNTWIQQGINDGVFLIVGSLKPNGGGCIVAQEINRELLELRVSEDPFILENIVSAEIIEFTPSRASKELDFLIK